MPVGTIDPQLKTISFWNGDDAIAALTYYATHPQSHLCTGMATPDFPGLAPNTRQDETQVPHILSTVQVAISAPANGAMALWKIGRRSPTR